MGSGFSKMKKQMRMMQDQMSQMKESLQKTLIQGTAGNGLVAVTINGEKDLKKISINPECASDVEGLQDLILAAFEDASKKLAALNENS
jgi:DNA-binding YbaB/EbfC family protein